ncbi:hypothetical protein EV122DRAFT_251873 [Schizophyllum commune]
MARTSATSGKPAKAKKAKGPTTKAAKATAKAAKEPETDDGDEESEDDESGEKGGQGRLRWTVELEWKIVSTITDDPDIKKGLYPPPKTDTAVGRKLKSANSVPKETHFWTVINAVMSTHAQYVDTWPLIAADPKKRKQWINKLKGKLRKMEKLVAEWRVKLGKTGEGVDTGNQVDTTKKNRFVNMNAQCLDACPWFWEFRNIIAERPNHVPQGVGNNSSTIDMSALGSDASTDSRTEENRMGTEIDIAPHRERSDIDELDTAPDDSSVVDDPVTSTTTHQELPSIQILSESESDSDFVEADPAPSATSTKRKAVISNTPKGPAKKTKTAASHGPKAAKSTPAAVPQGKAKGQFDKLRDLGLAEEETERARLEVERTRIAAAAEVKVAELEYRRKRKEDKAKYDLAKLELKYKLRMLKAQANVPSESSARAYPATFSGSFDDSFDMFGGSFNDAREAEQGTASDQMGAEGSRSGSWELGAP